MKRFIAFILLAFCCATASAQSSKSDVIKPVLATSIASSAAKIPDVVINPNPVVQAKTFTLELQNLAKGKYSVYLFDKNGKKYTVDIVNLESGSSTQQFDLPKDVTSGTYILQVVSKTARFSRKMIIE
jgi:uncharacterized protein YcfL